MRRSRGFTYGLGTNSLGNSGNDSGGIGSGGGSSVTPSALILTWYNSLVVKPSNALLTALNTLVDGLDADGIWSLLDLFGLIGGMETQEQQLRPLITTSGDDFVATDSPTLSVNGVKSDGGYLDLKWNPTSDGVQYTLNSAFFSTYFGVDGTPGYTNTYYCGAVDTTLNGSIFLNQQEGVNVMGIINDDGTLSGPTISNATSVFYFAIAIQGGNLILYKNTTTSTQAFATPVLCTLDLYGAAINADGVGAIDTSSAYLRHFMAGAGTANQTTIQSRLNTFYAARGL